MAIHYSNHVVANPELQQTATASKEDSTKTEPSKASPKSKASDSQQSDVKVDDDSFKIPQGRARHQKKVIASAEYKEYIARVLGKELDPENNLLEEMLMTHVITPHGLSEKEWRCYLLHLVNKVQTKSDLATIQKVSPGIGDKNLRGEHDKRQKEEAHFSIRSGSGYTLPGPVELNVLSIVFVAPNGQETSLPPLRVSLIIKE